MSTVNKVLHAMNQLTADELMEKLSESKAVKCGCDCHMLPPNGWLADVCCPDCGVSLIDIGKE